MSLLKGILILLLFLLKSYAGDEPVRLQKDFYLKKNSCNRSSSNYLNTVSFKLDFDKKTMPKSFLVGVMENHSKFSQTIFFNGENWFYPTWQSHTEYRLPECIQKICSGRFFVFLTDLPIKFKNWFFEVSVFDINKGNQKVLQNIFHVDNEFINSGEEHFEDLDVKYSKGEIRGQINKNKVRKLLKNKYNVQFIFQWRTNKNQQQYSEEFHNITVNHKWLKSSQKTFKMTKKVKNLTYLGFIIYITKEYKAYESKVEVLNQNDSFYNCR